MNPVVVDGNALVVRCIYGSVREEIANRLPFIGGIYSSFHLLGTILQHWQVRPSVVVVAFDHNPPPWRLELLPGYKSKRREDLTVFDSEEQKFEAFAQVAKVFELMPLLGIVTLCYRDREADDVVGAVTRLYLDRGEQPLVVSSDRDLWQTVGWGARVWDLRSGSILDADNFARKVGCSPDTYLLYKAIVGDVSDCIEGVPGLGEKRAAALLERAMWDVRAVREPAAQARELCRYVKKHREQCSKPERAIVRYRRRLERILAGIDLRTSFGGVRGLEARLDVVPKVRSLEFARRCKVYGVHRAHPALTQPFQRLEKSRR